jgi:hypothetical protein
LEVKKLLSPEDSHKDHQEREEHEEDKEGVVV